MHEGPRKRGPPGDNLPNEDTCPRGEGTGCNPVNTAVRIRQCPPMTRHSVTDAAEPAFGVYSTGSRNRISVGVWPKGKAHGCYPCSWRFESSRVSQPSRCRPKDGHILGKDVVWVRFPAAAPVGLWCNGNIRALQALGVRVRISLGPPTQHGSVGNAGYPAASYPAQRRFDSCPILQHGPVV